MQTLAHDKHRSSNAQLARISSAITVDPAIDYTYCSYQAAYLIESKVHVDALDWSGVLCAASRY